MPSYNITIEEIGPIKIEKKRGMRSIRMRINSKGEPVVSAPWHVPKSTVLRFIDERKDWIAKHSEINNKPFTSGMLVGDNLRLYISDKNRRNHSKVTNNQLMIKLAGLFDPSDASQQNYIEKKINDALSTKAENILLSRLNEISIYTGIDFNQGFVKKLYSRWGSCDQSKNIILNIYLLQVPQEIIDYVIIHELTHTKFLNHGKQFWDHVESFVPDYKKIKKDLKQYKTRIKIHNL